jgi:hypothetical protein
MAASFYYLTVSYGISSLELGSDSKLNGPYASEQLRQAAIDEDMTDRDLECGETVNITLLKTDATGRLERESSIIADFEDYQDDDDEEDDD